MTGGLPLRPEWPAPGPMAAVGSLLLAGMSFGRPDLGLATAALAALALAATLGETMAAIPPVPGTNPGRLLGGIAAVGAGWTVYLLSPHLPIGAGAIGLAVGTMAFVVALRPKGGRRPS